MKTSKKNRSGLKKILSVALMGTICLTAAVSVAAMSKTVTVTDGEKTLTINTINSDTESILRNTGIKLGENDKLVRTDDGSDGINISIVRAANVDAPEKDSKFSEASVAEALLTAGMTLSENESVSLAALESSDVETEIVLKRVNVSVNLRGKEMSKEVPEGTVKEALEYLNIKLGKNDIINVDVKSKVKEGMDIEIKKVVYKTETTVETIDYDTVYEETDTLYEGETSVKTVGEEGERTIVEKKKYVNGVVESVETISNTVTKKPVDQVILTGTAQQEVSPEQYTRVTSNGSLIVNEGASTITDSYGREVTYTNVITGSGTAYYAPAGSWTATGRTARPGVVAVNPNIIPYGTIMYIVSNDGEIDYGYAVAGDTGGGLMDNLIIVDLFYNTFEECCVFGRRDVTIYILDGVSEDITY